VSVVAGWLVVVVAAWVAASVVPVVLVAGVVVAASVVPLLLVAGVVVAWVAVSVVPVVPLLLVVGAAALLGLVAPVDADVVGSTAADGDDVDAVKSIELMLDPFLLRANVVPESVSYLPAPHHRAPAPESNVRSVFAQIARSIRSVRCRTYQRSYESFRAVLSQSAA
jgi:hypothetical protein